MTHPKTERTLVLIKPDGLQRSLIGEIIKRYERVGLKLVGLKLVVPSAKQIEQHYTIDPEWFAKTGAKAIQAYTARGLKHPISQDPVKVAKVVIEKLTKYLSSGPVVALVWQGAHAVELVRKITGGTEPRTSDIGTIRGDFVLDSYAMADGDNRAVRNLVHASGSAAEAKKEIALWFKPSEVLSYRLVQEQILYDVNLDGILE